MPIEGVGTRFLSGEVLIVSGDGDDPEATALKGQRCIFRRYVPHTGHCVVELEGKQLRYFRPQDLQRLNEGGQDK
jgi:hypothetical protein